MEHTYISGCGDMLGDAFHKVFGADYELEYINELLAKLFLIMDIPLTHLKFCWTVYAKAHHARIAKPGREPS